MKINQLIVLAFILTPLNLLFGQTDSSNFLKNYKAPDFKFRSLNINFNSVGNGRPKVESKFGLATGMTYFTYTNNSKIQGNSQSRAVISGDYYEDKNNNKYQSSLNVGFNHLMSNHYFINDNNWFLGLSDQSRISQNYFYLNDSIETNLSILNLYVNPTISIGKGRLEPIYYARKSWDIEKALLKSNSLDKGLTIDQKLILADKIAVIQNRRFFDSRLNRMYQLELIDSILQSMGIVEEMNMKYFTHLSDAFSFSHNPLRYSGKQFEVGVTQGFSLNSSNSQKSYDLNGFLSYAYFLPYSYNVQHNFKASISVGKQREFYYNTTFDRTLISLIFEYDFGYYPTTRTYFDIKGYVAGVVDNSVVGLKSKLYYYISPRFRVNASANAMMGLNNSSTNTDYNSYIKNNLLYSITGSPNQYDFRIGLDYAIF